ncbi:hypothetical protein [Halonatronum saccharophilum]|uniref:hypothetical protein n=1 Tax=Halonatronum saccharophilum TaxID=150060 RepID=UPI000483973E|nr:hypothetical protein [Halonatronum saccharophilum]
MKVIVNEEEVIIFQRAHLKDVIRKYSLKDYKEIVRGNKYVVDMYGNQVMLSGAVSEGESFTIIDKADEK